MHQRIAILEPQPTIRLHIERVLRDLGYDVVGMAEADLALVAIGSGSAAHEELVARMLEDEEGTPIVATGYSATSLVQAVESDRVFASLMRPFSRGQLSVALAEAGGSAPAEPEAGAVVTPTGSYVTTAASESEPVLDPEELQALEVQPMASFGPDSAVMSTFAPVLVGAAELIASSAEEIASIPPGSQRTEAVLQLLMQAGIVATDDP